MSVPTWRRKLSTTEYVWQTYKLNIRLGEILENKPKKYKPNYTDEIIQTALSALKHLQIVDSIYLSKTAPEQDYLERRRNLILARGEIQHIATACYIFLEIVRRHDYASEGEHKEDIAKLYDQEMEIGEQCEKCFELISGVIKSDTATYNKFIRPKQ